MRPSTVTVNGTPVALPPDPRVSLLDLLREYAGLPGTKKGCNEGACGACTVLVDGRAGVSHAAPAHHFGDRAGLLTALATEGFRRFDQHLQQTLAEHPRASVDQLPALARAYAQFADLHPGHFAVMFRPALIRMKDPTLAEASDAAFLTLRHHIERCQRAGWHAGADPQRLAVAAWALAHGISTLGRRAHSPATVATHHWTAWRT